MDELEIPYQQALGKPIFLGDSCTFTFVSWGNINQPIRAHKSKHVKGSSIRVRLVAFEITFLRNALQYSTDTSILLTENPQNFVSLVLYIANDRLNIKNTI